VLKPALQSGAKPNFIVILSGVTVDRQQLLRREVVLSAAAATAAAAAVNNSP
jgi:hypothetical protein